MKIDTVKPLNGEHLLDWSKLSAIRRCPFFPFFCLYQDMLTFSDKKGEKIGYIYNLGQNIYGLFYFLSQLVFTTSETKLAYYHQKVNVRVASRVAERLKDLRKLGNF